MKTILLIISLTIGTSAFAYNKCDSRVNRAVKGSEEIDLDAAFHYVTESNTLSERQTRRALQEIERPNTVLYVSTRTYMSGTGVNLLIVDQRSCRILKAINVYSE